MQGERSPVSTLPENLSFDHGSTSSDTGIDSQVPWNNIQTSAEARLPEYRVPSGETDTQYLHHIGHNEWSSGETSSGAARCQSHNNERKREHTWSVHTRAALNLEECSIESFLSMDTVDLNRQGNQTSNGSSLMQISEPNSVSQDLNICSEPGDQADDEHQVIDNLGRRIGSSNEKRPSTGSSSDTLGMSSGCSGSMEDNDGRLGCSQDGQHLSRKRKAHEAQVGQSSGAGTSNYFEHAERSQWHAVMPSQISATNVSMPTPVANNLVFSSGPEHAISRTRLGVGGAVSSNPLTSNARGTAESSRRNFRLPMSGSHQQDHIPGIPLSTEANVGHPDVSSSRHSRFIRRNRMFDLNPTPPAENGSHHSQPVLPRIPSLRRNPHLRWGAVSSLRTSSASSAAIALEREGGRGRERDPMLYEESISGNIPRSISEHPLFVRTSEMGGSSQQLRNWNLAGGSNSISGDVASASQAGSTSRVTSSSPSPLPFWSYRSYPQYPRRLSEMVRRTALSAAGTDPGGQSSSSAIRSSSPATLHETALSFESGNHGPNSSNTRSALLERHLGGPQYPRRLSEMVRRTLLSAAGTDSGGQSSSSVIRSSSPTTSHETALSFGSGNHGPNSSNSRSALLERHLDGVFGMPHSVRSLAAASERRSSVMSEIHRVLDVMRRGEGLRFEDIMMLDHSMFFGMPDLHDRHRDMRLDVDSMSYEELLALEDRIGNVCTGLEEETIMNALKQHKYAGGGDDGETEPCSICQEEYKDGEDVGRLECGHDFHRECIKQWLLHKNLCPICKTTGLLPPPPSST